MRLQRVERNNILKTNGVKAEVSMKHAQLKYINCNLAKETFVFNLGGIKKTMKTIRCFICSIVSCDFDKSGKRIMNQRLSCTASDSLWARIDR